MEQARNLIQEIQSGKVYPVYLLHGQETYLIEDTLGEMIDLLAPGKMRDFNLDIFSGPDVSVGEVLSMADTYPVMAERRVVVVKDPGFLGASAKVDPVQVLGDSMEQYRSGNRLRAGALLVRALGLTPEEVEEGETAVGRATNLFVKENESALSTEELEYLDEIAVEIMSELDVSSLLPSDGDADRFLKYVTDNPQSTTVLIIALTSELKSGSNILKSVSSKGKVISFGKLRSSYYVNKDPMYQMIVNKLREHKKTIAPQAFSELQRKTGNDMRQIFDELEKLVTFVGERQRIEKSDVESLVSRTAYDRIFDLTDAIGRRSLPLALANLKSVLGKGDHPILIHTMLTRQIRFLLQARLLMERGYLQPQVSRMSYDAFQKNVYKKLASELVEKLPESKSLNLLKQHPYALYLVLRQVGNFTLQELVQAMSRLLEADIQLKSGQLTPELVVELLVVDLVNKNDFSR